MNVLNILQLNLKSDLENIINNFIFVNLTTYQFKEVYHFIIIYLNIMHITKRFDDIKKIFELMEKLFNNKIKKEILFDFSLKILLKIKNFNQFESLLIMLIKLLKDKFYPFIWMINQKKSNQLLNLSCQLYSIRSKKEEVIDELIYSIPFSVKELISIHENQKKYKFYDHKFLINAITPLLLSIVYRYISKFRWKHPINSKKRIFNFLNPRIHGISNKKLIKLLYCLHNLKKYHMDIYYEDLNKLDSTYTDDSSDDSSDDEPNNLLFVIEQTSSISKNYFERKGKKKFDLGSLDKEKDELIAKIFYVLLDCEILNNDDFGILNNDLRFDSEYPEKLNIYDIICSVLDNITTNKKNFGCYTNQLYYNGKIDYEMDDDKYDGEYYIKKFLISNKKTINKYLF